MGQNWSRFGAGIGPGTTRMGRKWAWNLLGGIPFHLKRFIQFTPEWNWFNSYDFKYLGGWHQHTLSSLLLLFDAGLTVVMVIDFYSSDAPLYSCSKISRLLFLFLKLCGSKLLEGQSFSVACLCNHPWSYVGVPWMSLCLYLTFRSCRSGFMVFNITLQC